MTREKTKDAPNALVELPVAPAPSPAPAAPPPEPRQTISLELWLKHTGMKDDQTAGFRARARRTKMHARTRAEWKALYDAFLSRPV